MAIPVLILGESGAGKSASLRNLNPADNILIQPINKPLPFRTEWLAAGSKTVVRSDHSGQICDFIQRAARAGKRSVIIDDFQYIMANEFMRRSNETGFGKFTDIGRHAWDVVNCAAQVPGNMRVYFLSHVEADQNGRTKIKTIGRMLDEKITLEGMFTIVLGAQVVDGRHMFTTKNNGMDTVKAPMGMFETAEIDNDLKLVDDTICNYYSF